MKEKMKVLIRGAGDLASGVAYRLYQAGFKIVMTEVANPLAVRRKVAFSEAVYQEQVEIEGVIAQKANNTQEVEKIIADDKIAVTVDPKAKIKKELDFAILIDAIMAKKNLGTAINDAPVVIGLGPGFVAAKDVDYVIETKRGHRLGRVIRKGRAEKNTGLPGEIAGVSKKRVIKANNAGEFKTEHQIGDRIVKGESFGYINKQIIKAEISGVIRGILRSGVEVKTGTKLGDIDPRDNKANSALISDKALAIAGGVLEAILASTTNSKEKKGGKC